MQKRFFILISLLVCTNCVKGQDKETALLSLKDTIPKFHYGFCVGIGISSFKITEANILDATGGNLDTLDHREMVNGMPGSYFSFLFEYDFSKYFSLRLSPGFNFQQHAQNFYWKNGDIRLSRDSEILIHVPLHTSVGLPFKKSKINLLTGISLSYKYDINNSQRIFSHYTTLDIRAQYARKIKNWIGGIEFGFVKSITSIELPAGLLGAEQKVIDKVSIGYYTAGLILKF